MTRETPHEETAPESGASLSSEELLDLVKTSLEDGKAEDLTIIDLHGKTDIADTMVVASGQSRRHVTSMAENLAERLKKSGVPPRLEGLPAADWVLIDAYDVVVHLFRPEVRSFYDIEKMWSQASESREENRQKA